MVVSEANATGILIEGNHSTLINVGTSLLIISVPGFASSEMMV